MGTIVDRPRADGTTAYMAKIILKRKGKVVHRETKTFDRRQAANAWIVKREEELSKPGEIERTKTPSVSLAQVIKKYKQESVSPIRRTKAQVLTSILEFDIANKPCDEIASHDIIEFATQLSKTRKPQTVGNYLSHLSEVFTVARPAWNYPLDRRAMDDAQIVARRLGLIGRSDTRDRRPTLDELDKLMSHFAGRKVDAAPMLKITAFALFSTRRQEEITTIAWADLDEQHSRVMVRDMKNPTEKTGNNVWVDLPEPALKIIQSMPRTEAQIFPYLPDTIGTAFRDAVKLLGIHDLHFHDLRHEGISRLFEMGLSIPHVAAVSGHRSWQNLKRYTHIRQTGDKYAGWEWLEKVTKRQSF